MDNLTHSLFALTLANAGLRRAGRGVTATLLIASNVPDFEVVTTITRGRIAYLEVHRGATHGPAALLLAAATAAVVWGIYRARGGAQESGAGAGHAPGGSSQAGERASFLALLAIASLGVLGHIAMDFATSYGTRVLSPFTSAWFGIDWMPIVDLFLLGAMGIGLLATHFKPAARTRLAAAVLLFAAGDYAFRSAAHSAAVSRALELQEALQSAGSPTASPRPSPLFHYLGRSDPASLPAALPTIASPFRWRLVVPAKGGYLVTEMNLLDRHSRWHEAAVTQGVWFPNDAGPYVDRAAEANLGRVFLGFSRYPSAEILTHSNGDLTVHWYDLRFARRREPSGNDHRQHTSPFGAWVRLSPSGAVLAQGWGPG